MPGDPLDMLLGYLTSPAKFFYHLAGQTALRLGSTLPPQTEVVVRRSDAHLRGYCRPVGVGTWGQTMNLNQQLPKPTCLSALKSENKNVILPSNNHAQVVFPFSSLKDKTLF